MTKALNAVMFSSASDLWSTPVEFFRTLDDEFNFLIDLAATRETRRCGLYVGPDHGWGDNWNNYLTFDLPALFTGLQQPVAAFLNPPYSQCAEFVAKAASDARKGCTVVMLIPARPDTRYWAAHIWDHEQHQPRPGVEVRFLKGRLRFGNAKNSAPFPSAVIVFRPVA